MKRYNQGFGGFGIMEQCDDGKWVKYEEYEQEIDAYTEDLSKFYEESREELIRSWESEIGWKMISIISLFVLGLDVIFSFIECFVK